MNWSMKFQQDNNIGGLDVMSFLFTQKEVTEMRIRREKRELAEEIARNSAIKMLKKGKLSMEEISE